MASLLSARFFCDHCQKETHFLPIHFAVALTGVSRSTMYYWMDRRWVHWRELPSRRRIICKESLSHQGRPEASFQFETIRPKVSDSVQSRKLTGH
jgi:predicted DNA-binding transcriptional regulator AlpA